MVKAEKFIHPDTQMLREAGEEPKLKHRPTPNHQIIIQHGKKTRSKINRTRLQCST